MIQTGQLVYATDGELLGTVKEVSDAYVKLSAPLALDFLLPLACIHDSNEDVLRVTFPSGDLDQFRREPGSL